MADDITPEGLDRKPKPESQPTKGSGQADHKKPSRPGAGKPDPAHDRPDRVPKKN
jgi:hypothetical protein